MPPAAFALVALFTALSVVLGGVAWWIGARLGGPTARRWIVPPALAAFAAFYGIGHRLGIAIGPEVPLFGFQVALLGDVLLGGLAALATSGVLEIVLRRRPRATS